MKLIITGSNAVTKEQFDKAIDKSVLALQATEIINGGSHYGVENYALLWGYDRNLKMFVYEPRFLTYGKAAPKIRNAHMAEAGDALLVIWDKYCNNTSNMIHIWKRFYGEDKSRLEIIEVAGGNVTQ